MAVILLIRHAENDMVGVRLNGRLPGLHLNDRGRRQAEEVARWLSDAPLKALYCSPLERALETARPLAESHHLPIQVRQALLEVDYGRWQGKTFKQLRRMKLWNTVLSDPASARFPAGESLQEVQSRAVLEIETLAASHKPDDLLVCITHGDVVCLLAAHYLNIPLGSFRRLHAGTASVTVLLHREGHIHLPYINLPQLGSPCRSWSDLWMAPGIPPGPRK
jgi:probable phosphoglycerate mutase